jgi:uncharacterized protein YqfB (UPF0267 family)
MKKELKYKVVKVMRKTGNKKTLENNLTLDEAKRLVNAYPNSDKHMVVFYSY